MDVLSEEYLAWLEEETKDGNGLFCVVGSNAEGNQKYIADLFDRVDKYVKENYYFDVEEFGRIYNITDGKNFYTLYSVFGPDIAIFLRRANKKPSYINLDDVRQNVVSGKQNQEVLERMKTISRELKALSELGAPMELVASETKREILTLKMRKGGKK